MTNDTEAECHNCDNTWTYTGDKDVTTCPNCGLRTNPNDPEAATA